VKNPFVVGGWVRGERFFGRGALLQEALEGPRAYLWVLGTRRVGKTSFLKQLELRACEPGADGPRFVPLYWDLEGSRDVVGLRDSLLESIEAVPERFTGLGVVPAAIEPLDLFGILRTLKRQARAAGVRLLLLCDEGEELVQIERSAPETLPRLRRVFQEGESIRTVLAATKQLFQLERGATPETSPFLHGFVPPLHLGRFTDEEAAAIARQGGFPDDVVRAVLERTDNHPFLLQLVCKRLFEGGNLPEVAEEIASDEIVTHFFAVDYESLTPTERQIVLHVAQTHSASSQDLGGRLGLTTSQAGTLVHGLQQLGFIRHQGGLGGIPNWFFERWLRQEHGIEPQDPQADDGSFDGESSLELLRRAQDGDPHALVRLCARYHAAFRCWAEGRMPHAMRVQMGTEDLLREVLSGALGQLHTEREGELWDALRRELLRRIGEEMGRLHARGGPATPVEPEVLSSACPQEEVVGRETVRRYETALAQLDADERQAIVMRIEMGCSYEQVAGALGNPTVGAARMAVCRALVRLAREMSHA
jgi:RNA polymerase sigma-70 factor (ECF subfamily)